MEMELKQEEEEVALVATQVNTSPNSRTNVEPTTDDASLDQTIMDMEEGRRPAKALDDAKPKDSRKLKMKRKSLFLVLLTVALAVATAAVLWRCHGSPLLVAWRLSLSLCLVSFLWVIFLLGETITTTRAVFVRVSYAVLLACAADSSVGPAAGVVAVHLATHFAAGLVGYALADHRQREGTDRSAAAAAAADAMAGEKKRNFAHVVIFALCFGRTVVGYAGYAAWVAWRAAAGEYAAAGDGEMPELVRDLVAPMLGAELFAVIAAVAWLRGRLIDLYAVVFGGELYDGLVVVLVPLCSGALGGDVAAMVITWLAVLPFTGLLGYCLCVHDAFKRIVSEQQRRGAAELKPNLMNKESSNKWDEVLEELAERKE